MRILRCLFAFALVCGFSLTAKADTDFHMVVLDPPGYDVTTISDFSTLSITFNSCVAPGQIPTGSGYNGCFTFQNETGQAITNLEVSVNALISGQTVGCAASGLIDPNTNGPLDIFSNPSCVPLSDGYLLDYTGGEIKPGQIVTIAESGVDAADFPSTTITPTAATPEPSSFILLSTGVLSAGSMLAERRRRLFRSLRK
jgi:hypothetical protein